MKKFIVIMILNLILLTGCTNNEDIIIKDSPHLENLLVNFKFDENEGFYTEESVTKSLVLVDDLFYNEKDSLRWIKDSAVSNTALAFDGYTNKLSFDATNLKEDLEELTIDVFIAPRMFEWSAPDNYNNLQDIVGMYDKGNNLGFRLGMHKYGNYSFQIGLGDEWITLWNEWNPLNRYEWSHLTATFNGNTGYMAIYKNGELINDKKDVYGKIKFADTNLLIGSSQNPETLGVFELNMFNGLMDELQIFNKEYSFEDVIYNHEIFLVNNKLKEIKFSDAWLDEDILKDDPYRPVIHANPPQHWMNEPHALFYYNGYYHMFYQFNLTGPYWRQIVWGHWVSKDMVSWKNLKEPIIMDPKTPIKDGAWSGGVSYKNDGTPVLFVTAGDDRKDGLYSNQNLVLAYPKDINDPYLEEWVVSNELALKHNNTMGRANEFRDFNIYKEEGTYYLLATGSKNNYQGTALIFSTTDDSFTNWEYHGDFFEPEIYPSYFGTSWELVNLVKLTNESKTISKYLFAFSPAGAGSSNDVFYYLGNFNKETKRFEAEHSEAFKMDFGGNVFTGPGIFNDIEHDRVLISSITQDLRTGQEHYDTGWAHNAGMPKELSLDDNGNLVIKPIKELYSYLDTKLLDLNNINLNEVNESLSNLNIDNQIIYLKLKLTNINSNYYGLDFKINNEQYARIHYDDINKILTYDTTSFNHRSSRKYTENSLNLINNTLEIEILIDHSMVEIYLNKNHTITSSIYSLKQGFRLFAEDNILIDHISIYNINGKKDLK